MRLPAIPSGKREILAVVKSKMRQHNDGKKRKNKNKIFIILNEKLLNKKTFTTEGIIYLRRRK